MALALFLISTPDFLRNSPQQNSTILLSKSSPPRCVSPEVALTSNTPSSIYSNETSNVPPPKSKTRMFCSVPLFLSKPYAIAAAVGSLIILNGFRPEIMAASFVEFLYESLK